MSTFPPFLCCKSGGSVRPKLSPPKLSEVRVWPKLSGNNFPGVGERCDFPPSWVIARTCHLGPGQFPVGGCQFFWLLEVLNKAHFPQEEFHIFTFDISWMIGRVSDGMDVWLVELSCLHHVPPLHFSEANQCFRLYSPPRVRLRNNWTPSRRAS